MATTIKSTELDFDTIKNNLKTFLQQQAEFTDYNFEASGLSNILDVLAYNTHYNALIANMALNEAYLGTAQLRPSVVSIAESIGYIPDSITTSKSVVQLSLQLPEAVSHPATIQINNGKTFSGTVDDTTYIFQTLEDLEAVNDGSGFYSFKTASNNQNITLYEGTFKTKTFLVGPYEENLVYVIPDTRMDIETAVVKVYETASSSTYTTYTNILDVTTIDENSTVYILKESPNGYYELTFGDGNTLGRIPNAGNKVVVEYLRSNGATANRAQSFTPSTGITVNSVSYDLTTTTVSFSTGGSAKESIESIRKNAPFQYATQNRMVTAEDYASLVLRKFSNVITDINAWGGEDNLTPKYGVTFYSIRFNTDNATTIQTTKDAITSLANDLSVVSFGVEFADPVYTYVEGSVLFRFNDKLTSFSRNTITNSVRTTVQTYFNNAVGSFKQAFRRSNLLTQIDDVDTAVLSSRADIRLNQRITAQLTTVRDYRLRFPTEIAVPDDVNYVVTSTRFAYQGKTCEIKNRLNSTVLQIIDVATDNVVVDNVGEYTPNTGVVNIIGFAPTSITSGETFIKIVVVPGNQSAVEPVRNDILLYDADRTTVTAVLTSATN